MDTPIADILVVDDVPANLRLLVDMLKQQGYKVRPVPSGELALRAIKACLPDLILLDITMPDLDGFAVIDRIKSDPASAEIPVIFISALGDAADKVAAFRSGGVDYIAKPFQCEEVEARVRLHLDLRRQKSELGERFEQLHKLEKLRDDLTHMIVHDMRSPLLGLQLTLELLATAKLDPARFDRVVSGAQRSVSTLVAMVNQMLDVSRIESGHLQAKKAPTDLVKLAQDALAAGRWLSRNRAASIESPPELELAIDADLVRRVLENLLGNAWKFTPEEGSVTVRIAAEPTCARVEVEDSGCGIPPEHQRAIFEKYGQVEGPKKSQGSGLGLAFAKLAVEAHGGQIGVRSQPGSGSVFWFTLPAHIGSPV